VDALAGAVARAPLSTAHLFRKEVSVTHSAPPGCAFLFNPAGSQPSFSPERFSEEQRMFARTAEEFVEREIWPDIERLEHHEPGLMVEKLKKAGEVGLLMIDIPEAYGGLELDLATSMLCSEVMASYASWSVTHGAHTGIGTLPLLFFGNEEQRQKYLPKLATGELVAAYALTEPSSGSDAMNARTRAELVEGPDGREYWKLTGTKMWITNGGFADLFTVFAKVDGQAFTAFLVEVPAEGFSTGAEEQKMGIRGSSTVQLNLDGVLVPRENLLGEIGKGHKIAFNVLNVGRFKLGVGATGGAKRTLTTAIRYGKERVAFGHPITRFGAIRQKIADMTTRIYATESMCYRVGGTMVEAIETLDRADPRYSEQVMEAIEEYAVEDSIIKIYGSETLGFVVDEAVQIHGGYGFHQDYAVERSYRDTRVDRIFEGTNEINRMLVVGTLMKRTMKGQIPLFAVIQGLTAELEQEKAEPPPLDAPELAWEIFFTEAAKKLALYTANAAVQRFMTNLKDEQEILLALSDQLTEVYAMDSTVARVWHFPGPGQLAIARAVVADGYHRVLDLARRLAPSVVARTGLARHHAALDHFAYRCDADVVAVKRIVAELAIERETWPY
jgi:alkylation response protein AidB-like acyl-CoA dehydrogenase